GWSGTAGREDGQQRGVGGLEVVKSQVEFPEQQRLLLKAFENVFILGIEIKPCAVVIAFNDAGAEKIVEDGRVVAEGPVGGDEVCALLACVRKDRYRIVVEIGDFRHDDQLVFFYRI